jgi:hypothetical protein
VAKTEIPLGCGMFKGKGRRKLALSNKLSSLLRAEIQKLGNTKANNARKDFFEECIRKG